MLSKERHQTATGPELQRDNQGENAFMQIVALPRAVNRTDTEHLVMQILEKFYTYGSARSLIEALEKKYRPQPNFARAIRRSIDKQRKV
jgi:hypothetical protein